MLAERLHRHPPRPLASDVNRVFRGDMCCSISGVARSARPACSAVGLIGLGSFLHELDCRLWRCVVLSALRKGRAGCHPRGVRNQGFGFRDSCESRVETSHELLGLWHCSVELRCPVTPR